MAVTTLLDDFSVSLRELFSTRFDALGIRTVQDLAFLLGKETDAAMVAKEIFCDKTSLEVEEALVHVWRAATGPGEAIGLLETRNTVSTLQSNGVSTPFLCKRTT
jgi:hypothetical protein